MSLCKKDLIGILDIGADFIFITTHDGQYRARWKIDGDESFFKNHFLKRATLPASILLEGMLQTAVVSLYGTGLIIKTQKAIVFSTEMRLYRAIPGVKQTIEMNVSDVSMRRGIVEATVLASNDGQKVSKGLFKYKVE